MKRRYHGHVRADHGIVAYENISVINEVGVEIDYDIFPEVYIAKTVVGGYGRDDEQFFAVGVISLRIRVCSSKPSGVSGVALNSFNRCTHLCCCSMRLASTLSYNSPELSNL